ncbi:complex I 24 kDa subunit family protein [Petrotoga olearia]|uniref:NADH dehydrogenase n=2 Tax=Petrotoga olearia TaxID=156203 RepID=A0A2K1P457_9BACT|nr:NAD(P)H-dependent oxidoreductase subunit E [Petrotoga olearia]KUK15846.1 MAG: NADH dehydrogenase (Ubiquinone) 24 kDa subunit [Petrotoga mobilis]PNR97565.1 NADH dehydrogenase [Petrotoga olearia DSM 13574]RMA75292.1 NADP-reducing hydrogenase subunit HndA [Petrotoga olearia]
MEELLESKLKDVKTYLDSIDLNDKTEEERRSLLIEVLHKVQENLGYIPIEVQKLVARKLEIPSSQVYGVVTFYNFFTTKPKGKYPISVCLGTACYVGGANELLDEFKKILNVEEEEVTEDGLFSIHPVRCLGACGLAPVVKIGEKVHGRLKRNDVRKIIRDYRAKEK